MRKVRTKQTDGQVIVSYKLEKDEQVNSIELDIITRREIPGLETVKVNRSILGTELRVEMPCAQCLDKELRKGLPFGRFATLLLGLVKTVEESQARGIHLGNLEMRTEYIFCRGDEIHMVYWPLIDPTGQKPDIRNSFLLYGDAYQYQAGDETYYKAYMDLFETRAKFDVFQFERALRKLLDNWYGSRPEERPERRLPREREPIQAIRLAGPDGETIRVDRFPFSFGRDPAGCDHVFPGDMEVSRLHMSLRSHDGGIYVYDNRSMNGTMVNGTRIKAESETPISPGDVIQIGGQRIEYLAAEETGGLR